MKFKPYYFLFLFFISCANFGVRFPDYTFKYLSFNKKLDNTNNKKYLLSTTQFGAANLHIGSNLEHVVQFFKKNLGHNVTLKKDLKDADNKLLIPFLIAYDISKERLEFLRENTDLDYIILTKTLDLSAIKNKPLSNVHKKQLYRSAAGAVSFIKIIDVKNGKILLEMNCTGSVSNRKDTDIFTGEEQNRIYLYRSSKTLVEKTMKKLLKKIK